MIKSIKFSNFASFSGEGTIDFLVNEHAPKTHAFKKCGSDRLSKISTILGANGSGKSNALSSLSYLKKFIVDSFFLKPRHVLYNAYRLQEDQPSSFEVEFYIKQKLYRFHLKINKERVLLESLDYRPEQKMRNLYLREYNPTTNSYTFKVADELKLKKDFINMVRPNASVVSTAVQLNNERLFQIKEYWSNMTFSLYRNHASIEEIFNTSYFYFKNKDYFNEAKDYIRKMDLGLSDVQIKKGKGVRKSSQKEDILYLAFGQHRHKNKHFMLPFMEESHGTQQIYTLLRLILPSLKKGSPCVIDEFESSLHPDMLLFICNLFIQPETNPHGSQLLCTIHAPIILRLLSKYQVFLTEKNKNCESEMYRLDEIEGVRSDDDLAKKYLAGTYGGVPDI